MKFNKSMFKKSLWILVPTVSAITWYSVDRLLVKKAPLWPLSLKEAREKKAKSALVSAKKKLNILMSENKINSFGTRYDESENKYYIEVGATQVTDALINEIPKKVNGVDVVVVQKDIAQAL